jgi:Tol biopolymer transport system component
VAFARAWNPEEGPHELMNADGSAKRRITATRAYETNPVFSPDGTRITFYERP